MPFFAIGICTKNNEKTVGRTLESILKLKYDKDSIEIIIEDESSHDKTLNIVEDVLTGSGFKWNLSNLGLGYARKRVLVISLKEAQDSKEFI